MELGLSETQYIIMQQILGHRSGALSLEEIIYRIPDRPPERVERGLEQLNAVDLVTKLYAPRVDDDLPTDFYALTPEGIESLQEWQYCRGVSIWDESGEDILKRTDRIKRIEEREWRPDTPRWYEFYRPDD